MPSAGSRYSGNRRTNRPGTGDGALSVLAARWGLEHDEDNLMALVLTPEHLELRKRDEPKLGGIYVDFVGGAMAHRRKFGGGRGEAVAKAVGIKGDYLPDVVDATAGLGRDAFVLASVGCRVRMLERNPVCMFTSLCAKTDSLHDAAMTSFPSSPYPSREWSPPKRPA